MWTKKIIMQRVNIRKRWIKVINKVKWISFVTARVKMNCYLSTLHDFQIVVDSRWLDARLSGPWINFWAWLTCAHVTHARLMPQIADLRTVATLWTILLLLIERKFRFAVGDECLHKSYLIVALEWLEWIDSWDWRWIANPLESLPVCNDVNIIHGIDGVKEFDEAFFVMRLCEPSSMIVKSERRTVGCVMSVKVLHNHFSNAFRVGWVGASVAHRATTTIQILPHDHRHLPDAWITLCRAWWNHAIVEQFVIQGVRPAWWTVFVDRHRWIISEVEVMQHLEHSVSTNRQERSSHAANVFLLNATICRQDFTLASDFTCPFFQWELFTETVTVRGKENEALGTWELVKVSMF